MTPLHLAAEKGHADCIELLCAGGANANASDNWVSFPYAHASAPLIVCQRALFMFLPCTPFAVEEDAGAFSGHRWPRGCVRSAAEGRRQGPGPR